MDYVNVYMLDKTNKIPVTAKAHRHGEKNQIKGKVSYRPQKHFMRERALVLVLYQKNYIRAQISGEDGRTVQP